MSDLTRAIEEMAMAVRSVSDVLALSADMAFRFTKHRLPGGLPPSERETEELVRDALNAARRMAGISDRLCMEADRMAGPPTDAQAAARVDAMLEPIRILLDQAFDALMHLDADISDPKGELVQVYAHLDGARHKLRGIMEGDHGQA